MTSEQSLRWDAIKKDFLRNKAMGGDSADVGGKVVVQLADMVEGLNQLVSAANNKPDTDTSHQQSTLSEITALINGLGKKMIIKMKTYC